MTPTSTVNVLELLGLAYRNGVQLSGNGEALEIKIRPGKTPQPAVLEQLRDHQDVIYQYLLSREKDPQMDRVLAARTDRIPAGNADWYHIPKMHQHYWWVDASVEVEFKKNIYLCKAFRVSGPFCFEAARRAWQWVRQRHELLRTAFGTVDGKYYARIRSDAEPDESIAFLERIGAGCRKRRKSRSFRKFCGARS